MNDVRNLIDDGRITLLQYQVYAICFLLNALDGVDVLVISYAAPALGKEWAIAPQALGVVFSSGLVGMAAGAMFLAPIADRIGRRAMIIICVVLMGSTVLITAYAGSVNQLIPLRFASGLGIGALLASAATMSAEYAPARVRNLIVVVILSGYTVGATLAGLVAATVIPEFGWRAMFVVAGTATLVSLPLLWWFLPESLDYLLRVRPNGALSGVNAILARMKLGSLGELPERPEEVESSGVSSLFHARRARSTTLLWLAFFASFATLYFLLSWIPKLAANTGLAMNLAIYAGTVFNLGACFGIVTQGYLSLKFGLGRSIAAFMFVAAVLMSAFGLTSSSWAVLGMIGLIGFTVQGGFVGLYAIATRLYPTEIRSTGVGWAIGAGRSGAIIGPIVGGMLIAAGLTMSSNFIIFAIPMVVAGILTLMVRSPNQTSL